jgi:hypothetical protein
MYKRDDLCYLAGFIDGEGCFFIGLFKTKSKCTGKINFNYHTLLKISNNNYEVLEWIKERFGGSIDKRNRKQRLRQNEVATYSLEFSGNSLTDLTKELLPHLKIKKRHAEVMIKMRETFPRKIGKVFVSEETKLYRYNLMMELRTLNTRFHGHHLKQSIALAPCLPSATPLGVPSQSEQV